MKKFRKAKKMILTKNQDKEFELVLSGGDFAQKELYELGLDLDQVQELFFEVASAKDDYKFGLEGDKYFTVCTVRKEEISHFLLSAMNLLTGKNYLKTGLQAA